VTVFTAIWLFDFAGLKIGQQHPPGYDSGEVGEAAPDVRQPKRHPYGRQQHASHGWRERGVACQRGVGGEAQPAGAGYLSFGKAWAVDYASGNEGLLMAPAYAVPAIADGRGFWHCRISTITKIHEAFAAQVLCTLKGLGIARVLPEVLGLSEPLG